MYTCRDAWSYWCRTPGIFRSTNLPHTPAAPSGRAPRIASRAHHRPAALPSAYEVSPSQQQTAYSDRQNNAADEEENGDEMRSKG